MLNPVKTSLCSLLFLLTALSSNPVYADLNSAANMAVEGESVANTTSAVEPRFVRLIQQHFGVDSDHVHAGNFIDVSPVPLATTTAWKRAKDDLAYWQKQNWYVMLDKTYRFDDDRMMVLLNISIYDDEIYIKRCDTCPGLAAALFMERRDGSWVVKGKPMAIRALGTSGVLPTGAWRYTVNGEETDNPFFNYKPNKVAFTLSPMDRFSVQEHKGLMLFELNWQDVRALSDYIPIQYEGTQKRVWDGRFVDWLNRYGFKFSSKLFQMHKADTKINVVNDKVGNASLHFEISETFDVTDMLPTIGDNMKAVAIEGDNFNPPEIKLVYQLVNGKFQTIKQTNPIPVPIWAK